jgi:hypothetical protein
VGAAGWEYYAQWLITDELKLKETVTCRATRTDVSTSFDVRYFRSNPNTLFNRRIIRHSLVVSLLPWNPMIMSPSPYVTNGLEGVTNAKYSGIALGPRYAPVCAIR